MNTEPLSKTESVDESESCSDGSLGKNSDEKKKRTYEKPLKVNATFNDALRVLVREKPKK